MTERIVRISANGHTIVTYNPPRYSKRTLFNRVVKELKAMLPSILENESRKYYSLMLIDLKKMTEKKITNGEPHYNHRDGRIWYATSCEKKQMYETRYVLPFAYKITEYYENKDYNPKFQWDTKRIHRMCLYKLKQIRDLPETKWVVDKLKNEINHKIKYDKKYKDLQMTPEEFIDEYIYGDKWDAEIRKSLETELNQKYKKIPESAKHLPWVKIRYCVGKMNVVCSDFPSWSPLNYKRWGANGKCTNKGLSADTTYSWFDGTNKGGWTFGGLTADTLNLYCKQNQISTKGKTYRDLAIEYMKLP
jgi:hypothetical protein